MARTGVPSRIEAVVLLKSARRCALCFYLMGDLTEKLGQIAHLDHNPSNNDPDNLAFLCMEHHSLYDTKTRQHKNYTIYEAKAARAELYAAIADRKHFATSTPPKRKRAPKPSINVVAHPNQCIWSVGGQLQPSGKMKKLMQINFWALVTNNSDEPLNILESYPEGTKPEMNSFQEFLPPRRTVRKMISAFVLPILGMPGHPLRTRFILKDQMGRSYKTPQIEFRWVSSGIENQPD